MVATTRANEILIATLAGYGVQAGPKLTGGTVFYVDSGHADKADVVGGGNAWSTPFATIDFAVSQCEASAGDVIYVNAGHTEAVTATALLALDVAGISVIGLGNGTLRPTITFGTAAGAGVTVTAANILIKNLILQPLDVNTTLMLNIDSAACLVEDCWFNMDTGSYEAVAGIDLATAASNSVIKNCKFTSLTAGSSEGIKITGTAAGVRLEGNWIDGIFGVSGIWSDQVFVQALVLNNYVRNTSTTQHAIEFAAAATGICAGNRMYADVVSTAFDPGSMHCFDNLISTAIDSSGTLFPASAGGGEAGTGGDLDLSFLQTSPGNEYFVDSGAAASGSGKSWGEAAQTLDAAINLCTENGGDVIYVAPGHAENLGAAESVDVDIAGVTIIGVGTGALIPTFSITHVDGCIKIDDNSTTIKNIKILANIDNTKEGINITANGDDTLIEGCWFADTATNKELLIAISAANGADRVTIKDCKFIGAAGGATNAILMESAHVGTVIVGNYIFGDYSDYAIDLAAGANTECLVKDNIVHNIDVGAGLCIGGHANNTGTTLNNLCYGAKIGVPMILAGTANIGNQVVNVVGIPPEATDHLEAITSGKKIWVDSSHANAADTTGAGYTREYPCATLEAAVQLCTADSGDVIYVAAGHAEALGADSAVDIDKAGITVIGLGTGEVRPTFTFDTGVTADFKLAANSTHIENLRFFAGFDALTGPIEVTGTDCTIKNCEYHDVLATYQTTDVIVTVNNADRLTIDGFKFFGGDEAGTNSAIVLIGADHCEIKNCYLYGDMATGGINLRTTVSLGVRIHDCVIWTEAAEDLGINDTETNCTGIVGPNIYIRLNDNAANITTAVTAAKMCMMDQGVCIVNAEGEKSMAIDWTASVDE